MADLGHVLERRATLLAGKLTARKRILVQSLAPKGQRPPFTEQLSKADALAFWQAHRNDQQGAEVLARMNDVDIAELDAALAQTGGMGNGSIRTTFGG